MIPSGLKHESYNSDIKAYCKASQLVLVTNEHQRGAGIFAGIGLNIWEAEYGEEFYNSFNK